MGPCPLPPGRGQGSSPHAPGSAERHRWIWRRVRDGINLAITEIHALHLFKVEGTGTHPPKDAYLMTAYIHYPVPVHLQPAYAFLGHKPGEFPQAEAWAEECLSLPIYPELTESQQDRVVAEVEAFFAGTESAR